MPHSHPGPERAVDRFTPFYGHHPEGVHVKASDYDALAERHHRLVEAAREAKYQLSIRRAKGHCCDCEECHSFYAALDALAAALGEEGK